MIIAYVCNNLDALNHLRKTPKFQRCSTSSKTMKHEWKLCVLLKTSVMYLELKVFLNFLRIDDSCIRLQQFRCFELAMKNPKISKMFT